MKKANGGRLPNIDTSVSRMAFCTTVGADCEKRFTSSGGGIDLTKWKSSFSSLFSALEISRSNSESREPSSLRLPNGRMPLPNGEACPKDEVLSSGDVESSLLPLSPEGGFGGGGGGGGGVADPAWETQRGLTRSYVSAWGARRVPRALIGNTPGVNADDNADDNAESEATNAGVGRFCFIAIVVLRKETLQTPRAISELKTVVCCPIEGQQ